MNHFGTSLRVNLFGIDGARCGRVDASGRITGAAWGNSLAGNGNLSQFHRNRNLLTVGLCRARFDDTENGRYNLRYSSILDGSDNAVQVTNPQLLGSVPTNYIDCECGIAA